MRFFKKYKVQYDSTYDEVARIGKLVETESRIEVTKGWGEVWRGDSV